MECKEIVLPDYVIVLSGTAFLLSLIVAKPHVRSSVTVSGLHYKASFTSCGLHLHPVEFRETSICAQKRTSHNNMQELIYVSC